MYYFNWCHGFVRKIIMVFNFLILHEVAICNVLVGIVIFLIENLITFLIINEWMNKLIKMVSVVG